AEKAGGVDAAHAVRGQLSAALGVVDGDGGLPAHRRYPARREGRVALQARVADRLAYRGRAAGGLLHLGAFPEKDVVEAHVDVRHTEPPLLRRALEPGHRRPTMLDAVPSVTRPVAFQGEQAVSLAHRRAVAAAAPLVDGAAGALDGEPPASEATVPVRGPEIVRPRQRGVAEPVQPLPVLLQALL